ncbi:protein of unassigned function [Methylobacterium oryzae CBMB20]|uniref:Protein of unassigned function n=1 Tax=Methylobacterium oryzae CBMB20 TaxID=693986 RepID=A0A089NY99_9HYPH|nr:protein of unassigned function [Methylobacterium oryzae CBMB20]
MRSRHQVIRRPNYAPRIDRAGRVLRPGGFTSRATSALSIPLMA